MAIDYNVNKNSVTFFMDAANTAFTNSKNNPIRPWFFRMVQQLEKNFYEKGLVWDDFEMHIVIHPGIWGCISLLYSFDNYYLSEKGNVYLKEVTDEVRNRHDEFLAKRSLPIEGRMYPVVLDSKYPKSSIYFVVQDVLGRIQNVNCELDYGDKPRTYNYTRIKSPFRFRALPKLT